MGLVVVILCRPGANLPPPAAELHTDYNILSKQKTIDQTRLNCNDCYIPHHDMVLHARDAHHWPHVVLDDAISGAWFRVV